MAFADVFTFGRATQATYLDAAGVTHLATFDQPRFDHDGQGRPLGLLVEAGAGFGLGDRVQSIGGDWTSLTKATVLHLWTNANGVVLIEGHYSVRPQAMVDRCLAAVGRHQYVAVVAGDLQNYGGFVWALGKRWYLPRLLAVNEAETPLGASSARPFLAT